VNDDLIALCIPSYRRNRLLGECLGAVAALQPPAGHRIEVVVADNDREGGARQLVHDMAATLPWPLHYHVEPERGLASVRNRLLHEAVKLGATLIAFIDDDEQPDSAWLVEHIRALKNYGARVSTGPVAPLDPGQALQHAKHRPTGSRPRYVSTNNVVFHTTLVRDQGLRFDPYFNFIGGEDFDFFERSGQLQNVHVWCAEALVRESVPKQRDSLRYLFYRHFSGGINSVLRYRRHGPLPGAWLRFLPKSLGKFLGAGLALLAAFLTASRVRLASSVKKCASGLGYLAGLLNVVVERYRDIEADP